MKVSVGSDHRGVGTKDKALHVLSELGYETDDQGTNSNDSCDYPDFAQRVAHQVSQGNADRGILICGSGIGMSIAANKFPNVRAALCHDVHDAAMSRRHNDANVLCLSGDRIESSHDSNLLREMISIWMTTDFDGGRHQRRVDKIANQSNNAIVNE